MLVFLRYYLVPSTGRLICLTLLRWRPQPADRCCCY